MTSVDFVVIVLVVAYAVLGLYTGVIRRVIGFLVLFLAFGAATYLAPDGGRFLQQAIHTGLEPADARIYAFFGFAILVIVLIEGLAQAYHGVLQVAVVPLDRATGLLLGVITGLVLSVLVVWNLNAMGSPASANPTVLQTSIREAVDGSVTHTPLLRTGTPVTKIFSPVLPTEPQKYYSPGAHTG